MGLAKDLVLSKLMSNGNGSGNTGGGGDEASVLDSLIDRSITEISSNVKSVGDCAFYKCKQLTSVNLPEVITVGEESFYTAPALTFVNLPKATTLGNSAFETCYNLSEFYAPNLISIGDTAIRSTKITSINFPLVTSAGNGAFMQNNSLTTADFAQKIAIITNAFYGCINLTAFILRSETMATLSTTSAFTKTPIASGTGYIYVPRALVDTYKSATNWSTYASQFRALEDYTVDGTINGELDESKI